MAPFEPKKLALIRIWQILKEHSDIDHPLTQQTIAQHLESDYGIPIERKTISHNLSLLREAGAEIVSTREGSYLAGRNFEDAELRLLIDGVLCSKHITATYSADLIDRLCRLSNRYFRSHVKNICTVHDWSKTANQELFLNIELVDEAIEQGRCIAYDYNKFGIDKKLHKSSRQLVTPYQLILHNQRYYLMAHSERWGDMTFHRLDHITNMQISEQPGTPLRSLPGYENGIDYKQIASAMPYMYTDAPVRIELAARTDAIDQIIDWFGTDIRIAPIPEDAAHVSVRVMASPMAMEHWIMQYSDCVEVLAPASLRERIRQRLEDALRKY